MIGRKHKAPGRSGGIRDLVTLFAITLCATAIFLYFDLYQNSHPLLTALERHRMEELILSALVFSLGLVWFSYRRWKELDKENAARRLTEAALKESEEKYRDLVEDIGETLYTTDSRGIITYITPAIKSLINKEPSEIVGRPFMEFIYEDDLPVITRRFHEILNSGATLGGGEYRVVNSAGEICWVRTSSKPAYKGDQITGVKGMLSDVTQRKRAEKALKESEEKYRLLIENSNDAIFIAQDGVLKFPNPRARQMIGRSSEELSMVKFVELIHPDDRAMVAERHQRRLAGLETPPTYTFRYLNGEGEVSWAQLSSVAVTWEGRPATLNFLMDITEQKKLEAQFQQAQRIESLGTLAGGIAHDFNNILMGVMGNASLMLMNLKHDHPHHERLRIIQKLAESGSELTKQLLCYARKGQYEITSIDLNEMISETLNTLGRTKKEIRVHCDFDEDLAAIEAEKSQIEQVLLNLYVNAAEAMPRGGDLYLKTSNVTHKQMDGKSYDPKPGKYVLLAITDTGVGMSKEVRQRVFDPFFTTKEMGRGTGLGLASVYGIVKGHGGYIDVTSEVDSGATFEVYLPASDSKPQLSANSKEAVVKGTGTIFIVDDEEFILSVAKDMLEHLNYDVYAADSGQRALEVYRERQAEIDLVILDMIMPDMNGGDVYDRLKEINPGVRVLLSSGYALDGQAQEILNRGCDGFIQKPFSIKDLSQKIEELIQDELAFKGGASVNNSGAK